MVENVGIFQVTSNCISQKYDVIGTAFAIKTYEDGNKYYLLTAYHVISELEAKGHPIIIKDENESFYVATKVFPSNLSKVYREFGQDYALLEMYSEIKYQTYKIAITDKRPRCIVRGAVPHFSTKFTSFTGMILGEESIYGQEKKVLQLKLDTILIFDHENKPIPEQKILRGLSGAPVLIEINDETVCIGVLGNLERDCQGSVKYAVPIRTIIEECLNPEGIVHQYGKEENYYTFSDKAFIELAFGDTEDFIFSEEKLEQKSWDKLSNLFYKGIQVDAILKKIVEADLFLKYSAEVKCAILYYYARLLFKRGNHDLAIKAFHDISKMLIDVSADTKIKLNALINSRTVIEDKIKLPGETLSAIRRAGDKIANLSNVSKEYVSYELASMYGRGLTNLFSVNADFTPSEKEELSKIYDEHKCLLDNNPVGLCKQDVVNTSLQWYIEFWCVNKEYDLQSLSDATNRGFLQSRKRKNGIFYIQCMISYSILCFLNGDKVKAAKILLLSVKLMRQEKVNLNHEGIRQLFVFLKEKCISLYAVAELAYKTSNDYQLIRKVSLYKMDLGLQSWDSIINKVNEFYAFNYNSNIQIYDVGVDDIKNIF